MRKRLLCRPPRSVFAHATTSSIQLIAIPGTQGAKKVRPICCSHTRTLSIISGKRVAHFQNVVFVGVHAGGAAHAREPERVERIDLLVVVQEIVEAHLLSANRRLGCTDRSRRSRPTRPTGDGRVPAIHRGARPKSGHSCHWGKPREASGESVAVSTCRVQNWRLRDGKMPRISAMRTKVSGSSASKPRSAAVSGSRPHIADDGLDANDWMHMLRIPGDVFDSQRVFIASGVRVYEDDLSGAVAVQHESRSCLRVDAA